MIGGEGREDAEQQQLLTTTRTRTFLLLTFDRSRRTVWPRGQAAAPGAGAGASTT